MPVCSSAFSSCSVCAMTHLANHEVMHSPTTPVRRSPLTYGVALALTIGAGLLWRSNLLPLSNFVAKYGGDALWAFVVFLGCGLVFHRSSTVGVALISVCCAWSVEVLQLFHTPWIDAVRSTHFGRLALGNSFNSPDLLAYVAGIGLGALTECCVYRKERGHVD